MVALPRALTAATSVFASRAAASRATSSALGTAMSMPGTTFVVMRVRGISRDDGAVVVELLGERDGRRERLVVRRAVKRPLEHARALLTPSRTVCSPDDGK